MKYFSVTSWLESLNGFLEFQMPLSHICIYRNDSSYLTTKLDTILLHQTIFLCEKCMTTCFSWKIVIVGNLKIYL